MSRWRYLLLLALIFGALKVDAQECEDIGTSETNAIDDTEDTFILTKDICVDAHKSAYLGSKCCDGKFTTNDEDFEFCTPKIKFNYEKEDKRITQFSKLAECIYKRKKYIKDSRHLNYDQIEADAALVGDSLQQQFMLDVFRYCGCTAKTSLDNLDNEVRANPKRKMWRMSLRKPYFCYVIMCFVNYPETQQCPYFRYASGDNDMHNKCLNYAKKCEELMKE